MDKKIPHLPKDGVVEPQDLRRLSADDVEGHVRSRPDIRNSEEPRPQDARLIDENDAEGHGLPLTAPPSFLGSRQPGHGGENIPSPVDDDDVEGHRRI